ncbi:MAG: flagellar basal body rod protein FlgB [Acidobacteriota bacterium]|nr:flagellar basal body rod protein FlgB [Acidobacteriota bacterium]
MDVGTRLSEQLAHYIDLASDEAKLTAANMANIDTPGYRAVGMDFSREMKATMAQLDEGSVQHTAKVREVDGLISRPDGNDVSMDRESVNLAAAQLKFKTGVALLHMEYQRINDAIHADK